MSDSIWYKELKNNDVNVYIGRRKVGEIIWCYGNEECYYKPVGRGRNYQPDKFYKTLKEIKADLEGEPLSK